MVATNEQTLLSQLRSPATQAQAFEQVVKQHQKMLYYHIRRMVHEHDDADDVLQNTFLKAWKSLDRFRGDAALRTWLYRIATNEALTYLSRKKRRNHTDISDIQDDMRHSASAQAAAPVEGDKIQALLRKAIQTLPDRQKAVFTLRYFDEMKYDEIARVLEVSVGSLKASYHHAAKKIEQYLTTHSAQRR